MSFFSEFFQVAEGVQEHSVLCPFDHVTSSGLLYRESHPSAHVNTAEHLFHCKACGKGLSEVQFIQEIFGCDFISAKKIQRCFQNGENRESWKSCTLEAGSVEQALSVGIPKEILKQLEVKTPTGSSKGLCFPVFVLGHLMDIRTYNPGGIPKVKSRTNCPAGLIIPFDEWQQTDKGKVTILCAGEKDMAIARANGLNAITITGGENTLPILLKSFADRTVAICYDNDDAGIRGARRIARAIKPYAKKVKVVTGFHEVCCLEKEDITDFFVKYGKTKDDLVKYIIDTPEYEPTDEELRSSYALVDLATASKPDHIGKMVSTNIQVIAVSDASFTVPGAIIGEKLRMSGNNDTIMPGDIREWQLTEENCQDILHLMDNGFTEESIRKNSRDLLKVPQKESYMRIQALTRRTIYKVSITDMFETTARDTQPMEFTAYAIDCKLESGKKYLVTHKLVPHPYKGQQLYMIITSAVQASDSVSNFKVTAAVKEDLNVIRNLEGSVKDRVETITNKVKGLLGYNGNNTLIQAIDLSYHTALQFNFGTFKNVRGYLDTIVVGESRMGKSSTADTLRKTYGLGVFTSLAGNSATIPGLIGGSNKTGGTFQTRAGMIPQNHRGLIIFEEFGKCNANIIRELTDIRSSNEVRITRVSGTMTLPAIVRMITLTNVKNTDGTIKPIASYPNGISIITELIGTAEDIARYDLMVVLSDRGASQIDPFWTPQQPFAESVYKSRVRWIWSRTTEQIKIDQNVGYYILEKANELNNTYDSHIKIFGTEAWKKIARVAIAVAGYLVSTDDEFENIIVTKEHVDFAVDFYKKIYDNPTFKLREYVEHERKFSTIDNDGVAALQNLYNKHPSLILQLEQCSSASRPMLCAATGLTNDELSKALNLLTKGLFVRFVNHDIMPTERFRLGLTHLSRNTHVAGLGE